MLNVDLNNPADVRNAGMKALREALGPVGMVKFIKQFDLGYGDYTEETVSYTHLLRSAQIYPEFSFEWVEKEFDTMDKRSADPFKISEAAKSELKEAFKYWKGKTTSDLASARCV